MTEEKKPTRTLELSVDIDAPVDEVWKAITEGPGVQNWFAPNASVANPGPGAEITVSWSPEMAWTTNIPVWEAGRHLQWLNDDMMGPGTRLTLDYFLSTEDGKTRLRLVQSAFGESGGWDDFFEGTETGWTYFLYNLRIYLEKHLGRVRRLISTRVPVSMPRGKAWEKLLSSGAGLLVGAGVAMQAGKAVEVALGDPGTQRAVLDLIIEGHALALRIPDLGDSLLFVEFEGRTDEFHIGIYLSVYDPAAATRVEAPAQRAFERVRAALR
jgi:uncharacterized protein YndB with AHSA1/START domain